MSMLARKRTLADSLLLEAEAGWSSAASTAAGAGAGAMFLMVSASFTPAD